MKNQLITKNVWQEITNAAKNTRSKSIVAVAYFGQGGARMLPLKKGSLLLVDASEKAVKSGQTCPVELLKLYKKGVHIFSLANLHSKVFVIGNNLYIGSANVSAYSANILNEAVYKTSDRKSVKKAKEYVMSFCKVELGEEQLKRLQKKYNPPKFFGEDKLGLIKKRHIDKDETSFLIYHLESGKRKESEMKHYYKGNAEAMKKMENKSRHNLDNFNWDGSLTAKNGDIILQVVREGNGLYVSPPGRLIYIKKWKINGKNNYICFVEIPYTKRKNINWILKKLKPSEKKEFKRNGRRSKAFAEKMYSLWPSY